MLRFDPVFFVVFVVCGKHFVILIHCWSMVLIFAVIMLHRTSKWYSVLLNVTAYKGRLVYSPSKSLYELAIVLKVL